MRLAATDWPAVESFSTAVAAAIALIAVLVTLWVYSRQNRLARAAAIRSLLGVVLRDSGEIYYLTFGSAIEVAESGVREFRKKLGRSADADTFRKYFFQPDNEFHWIIWSSFMEGYVTSPAYSRLSNLWDEIEKASAELRGMLKIFNHSAKLIADTSIGACYPSLSFQLAEEMQHDSELANDYQKITNLDELTLAAATKLGHMLHQDLGPGWPVRLFQLVSFVEDLYAAISEMSDRSVLKLRLDRRFDWNYFSMVPATSPSPTASAPATEGGSAGIPDEPYDLEKRRQRRAEERQQKGTEQIKLIEKLLADLESLLSAEDFTKLKNRIEICKKTYDPDYKDEQEIRLRDEPETRHVSTAGLSGKRQTQI